MLEGGGRVDRAYNLGRMMAHCGHLGRMCLEERLRQYNITPVQAHALRYLSKQPPDREVTHRDMERELRLKPSTVNGIVERMEEKGLITRKTSSSDGRCRLIRLTQQGLSLSLAIDEAIDDTEDLLCAALSSSEQGTLHNMLQRMILYLENEVHHT